MGERTLTDVGPARSDATDDAVALEPAGEPADDDPDTAAAVEAADNGRLTHALHWAQQGSSPEVSQGRWLRRLAGQSQQRLESQLSDEQIDDVAMVAALVHAEAMAEGAAAARRHMVRSRVLAFAGTVIGAALGSAAVQYALSGILT